jgi:hypothetical protein
MTKPPPTPHDAPTPPVSPRFSASRWSAVVEAAFLLSVRSR